MIDDTDAPLKLLRSSLRYVAEAANRQGACLVIPTGDDHWNTLCCGLIEWIEAEPKRHYLWR